MICVNSAGLPCLICERCESKLNTILDSEDRGAISDALDYIYSKFDGSHSSVVMQAVNDIIAEGNEIAREMGEKRSKK